MKKATIIKIISIVILIGLFITFVPVIKVNAIVLCGPFEVGDVSSSYPKASRLVPILEAIILKFNPYRYSIVC